MPGLPAPAERALDLALVSLAAYHTVDWLVRCLPGGASLSETVMATGLHVGEVTSAVAALERRGVLVAEAGELRVSATHASGLSEAWRCIGRDSGLRRRALGLAADRERVVPATAPASPDSRAASGHVVACPMRSSDPADRAA